LFSRFICGHETAILSVGSVGMFVVVFVVCVGVLCDKKCNYQVPVVVCEVSFFFLNVSNVVMRVRANGVCSLSFCFF
jgi:hypothetical protein